ncbi:GNAT family N-acetyltransferase [Amycolatopsis sp. NPDC059657]|uniref:bifunctional acetate--CoA ligase family protein/GNAT family N-acetyltransferase n=1 Tax=Amycolatopsis sp. NPDC059657 TaxID=3346899 RepID=UPI00366E949C
MTNALLSDGVVVAVRPLADADFNAVLALHQGLDEHDVYMRFFTAHPVKLNRLVQDIVAGQSVGAFLGGRLIGVANYQPRPGTGDAEVALVVDGTVQTHGVGTLLLEHLVSMARQRGVTRFFAEVLAENAKMVRVFVDLGLPYTISRSGAEREVELLLTEPESYLDAVGQRERVAEVASLRSLLMPRSVAVIGASRRRGSVGNAVLRNLVDGGYGGDLYAVNPNADEILGVPCVATVPVAVDLAVICVPAELVPGVIDECGARGVRAVVLITAGMTGTEFGDRVRESVHRSGIRLVGPNCFGVANTGIRLDATFARDTVPSGRVGVATQSGGFGIALLESLATLGLGVSTLVSTGDKYDVSGNDLLLWWQQDERTDIAVLYLESFGNPRKFSRFARTLARRKPVLAVRGAGTALAQRAAASHTAAAIVPSATKDALFEQAGVTVLDTITELVELIAALSWQPLPAGDRVVVVSNAGGAAVLAADACVRHGLTMPELSPATLDTVRALLPGHASLHNPLDTSAAVAPEVFAACVEAVLADEGVDGVIAAGVPTGAGDPLATMRSHGGKPVLAVRLGQLESVTRLADDVPIPSYGDAEAAAGVMARLVRRARWLSLPSGQVPDLPEVDLATAKGLVSGYSKPGWLSHADSVELLACFGMEVAAAAGRQLIVRGESDDTFGPVIEFGLGGENCDLLDDRAVRLGPLTLEDADALIHGLRNSAKIFGDGEDLAPLRDILVRVSRLVELLPEVVEVNLDPVVLTPDGCEVGAVRVFVEPSRLPEDPYLRRLRA